MDLDLLTVQPFLHVLMVSGRRTPPLLWDCVSLGPAFLESSTALGTLNAH